MINTVAGIRAMTKDELIETYNGRSVNSDPGSEFFISELRRREQSEIEQSMLAMTRRIELATYVAVTASVLSLFLVLFK